MYWAQDNCTNMNYLLTNILYTKTLNKISRKPYPNHKRYSISITT